MKKESIIIEAINNNISLIENICFDDNILDDIYSFVEIKFIISVDKKVNIETIKEKEYIFFNS